MAPPKRSFLRPFSLRRPSNGFFPLENPKEHRACRGVKQGNGWGKRWFLPLCQTQKGGCSWSVRLSASGCRPGRISAATKHGRRPHVHPSLGLIWSIFASAPSKRMRTRLAPLPVFSHVPVPPSVGGKYLLLTFLLFIHKRNIEYCYKGFKTHYWDFIYNRFKNLPFPRKNRFHAEARRTRRRSLSPRSPRLRVRKSLSSPSAIF